MKLVKLVVTLSLIALVPWFFYANQTQQQLACVMYQLSGAKPGIVQQVTCALNGHAQ